MGGIYAQIRQRQCRALTLCCCHETARVCVATSCGASFIQFRFHAMEAAWSMACVILHQTRFAAIACAVLLAYVKPWLSCCDQLLPLMNRGLVTKALEMIEVDVRTTISHYFGKRHGAFGHIDPINFFVSAPNKQG